MAGRDTDRISEELRAIVLKTMAIRAWDRRFRDLVQLTDAATISALTVRTASPVAPRPTQRITVLGDAIHAMTPHRGIGANVALKDAVRLCRALQAVNCGEQTFSMRFAPTRPR